MLCVIDLFSYVCGTRIAVSICGHTESFLTRHVVRAVAFVPLSGWKSLTENEGFGGNCVRKRDGLPTEQAERKKCKELTRPAAFG